jgi:hypothetical protein
MKSELDIYIEKILNPKVLIVNDASFYNPDIAVTNAKLEIQYPNSNVFINIPVSKNFSYKVNSNTLNITKVNKKNALSKLPDGLWTIKYSICPNDALFVEYTFLRNINQLIKYNNLYCELELNKCDKKSYLEELKKLREIKDLIDASEYLADCGKYEKSIEIYKGIEELLAEYKEDCNCK